jgi:acid phosphatase
LAVIMSFTSKDRSVATATFVLVAILVSSCEHHLPPSPPGLDTTAVASVTVSPSSPTVRVGQAVQLTATPKDASGAPLAGRVVTWATSDSGVARVSTTGLVTGRAAGSPTITATSEGKSGTSAITVTVPTSGGPRFNHVFIVVEENTDYPSVIGSSSMPYLNGLAQQYGLATQYYANTHPSIGNYFMMTAGKIITNDDSYATIVTDDNVVRRLLAANKTWKSYAEDLPSVGYTGGDAGNYARKHNVIALLSDVANDPVQRNNLVPFTQFATDLTNNTFANYSFVVPNLCNDAHDCSLSTADTWLRTNIDPLVKSAQFQQDGLLIILFDEGSASSTNGGGRVAWVAVSGKSKAGYQSTTLYQHASTLRLSLKVLGVTAYPNGAVTAPDMDEFFNP